jgi:hypothetical protein
MYYASLAAKIDVAAYYDPPENVEDVFDFFTYQKIDEDDATMKWKEMTVVAKYTDSTHGETCILGFMGADADDMLISGDDMVGGYYVSFDNGIEVGLTGWLGHAGASFSAQINQCSVLPAAATTTNDMFIRKGDVGQMLVDCYNACEDPDCNLVISGHSAGGAEAALAPMFMNYLIADQVPSHWTANPLVITFGSFSPVTDNDCLEHNLDNHFAFTRVRDGFVDNIGSLIKNAPKTGLHQLIIGDNVDDMKWYPRTGGGVSFSTDVFSVIAATTVHEMGRYYDDVGDATKAGTTFDAFSTDGFPKGDLCYQNKGLCASNTCVNDICV